jgi:pilus assembly protein FimV
MKGSLKLSLAVALALAGSEALALGLGMIQVRSGLNEPLVAEIPVTGGPDETSSLSVALAAAADFERVGLSRSRVQVPLEFTVAAGAKGAVIKVTSKEPVRDPFLDFLIEVNWAKGKLLREYTVLLDPPTMAPAIKGSRASTAPVKEAATAAAPSQPLPTAKPGKAPRPTKPAEPVAAATPPATPPAEKPARPAPSAAAGEYGPVAAGETLWEVAASTRPDDNVTLNQVMIALHRNNPGAFFKDNINSLKRGAILRVPSVEEIKAVGNAAAAAAEVRNQNDAARSGTATPTLVADSAASSTSAPASAPSTKAAQPDRLALVPPKSTKDAKPTAESAGSGSSASGDVTTRAELARTKEALASREQETSELKSRVRELEEIRNKNDKLISLKDSELAELQRKLKEMQDKAAKPGAATAATPPAATPPAATSTATPKAGEPAKAGEFSKEEIWGNAAGDKAPGTATTAPTTGATPPATGTTPPAAATTPPAATTTPPATTPPASTTSTLPPATATPSTGTAAPATGTTPPATSTTTPPATTAPAATTPAPAATPPKPAASTAAPVKTPAPAKVQPLTDDTPWWQKTWVLAVGGLALLAVVALALMNLLRRPKVAPVADAGAGDNAFAGGYDEEHGLLDRLAQYPDDTSAHLELTSLYYAQGQTDKFEDAAQAMYAHISDTSMAEWQQVRAMGRELAPHNPLFADEPSYQPHHHTAAASAFGSAEPEPMRFDGFDDVGSFGKTTPAAPLPEEDTFDFDLADRSATTQTIPAPAAPARDEFSLDLPPMDFDTRAPAAPTPAPSYSTPAPPARIEEDFLSTDDAIGTKLDLAKAYLDMGDPDGAKSMLEEVITEGSDAQKAEARKLLAEIR